MSDAAAAGATSAGSSSSTSATPNSPNQVASSEGSAGANEKKTQNQSQTEEFAEIKLGSVQGKVPKQIAEAIKNYEKGFHTKAQQAAQLEKLVELGKKDPKNFFKQTGLDIYEFAESVLAEKFEEMQMTPEQKKLRELEQWKQEKENSEMSSKREVLEALKEFGPLPEGAEKASKDQLEAYLQRQKETYQKEWSTLDQQIGEAFKSSGIPADKYVIAKVAFEMSSALKRGKNLTAQEAVEKVKGEFFGGVKNLFGQMEVKNIHDLLGGEFLDKLRKYDLDSVTAQAAQKIGQQSFGQVNKTSSQDNSKKYLTESEWRKKYRG